MMRTWFWTLLLLVVAVALAVVLREHGGNVILVLPPWRVQVSTTLAVLLLIGLFAALYLGLRLFAWLLAIPERMRAWRGRRAQRRDHDLLERGWVELLQGRYAQAETDLTRLLAQTKVPDRKVLAALSAARAAQGLGKYRRRDVLLDQARDYLSAQSNLRQAVAVAGAEMLLEQGQPAEALRKLAGQNENHCPPHVARLLLRAHDELGHCAQVLTLTRNLVRRGLIERHEAAKLIDPAGAQLLRQAQGDAWRAIWKDLKADERTLPQIALAGAAACEAQGKSDEAARILEAAIAVNLAPELLVAYARCDASQVPQRLEKAEIWRKKYPDDPDLLSLLGELCLVGQIWGAAERYLQRSVQQRNHSRAHALLGNLYDRLDRPALARRYWRQASMTAAGMALPVLASDAALPAADTRADPVVPDLDNLEEITPFALGGATVVAPRVANPVEPIQMAEASDTPVASAEHADIEDLFDSALIPGIEPVAVDSAPSHDAQTQASR